MGEAKVTQKGRTFYKGQQTFSRDTLIPLWGTMHSRPSELKKSELQHQPPSENAISIYNPGTATSQLHQRGPSHPFSPHGSRVLRQSCAHVLDRARGVHSGGSCSPGKLLPEDKAEPGTYYTDATCVGKRAPGQLKRQGPTRATGHARLR